MDITNGFIANPTYYIETTYAFYLLISIGLTIWVARTLHKNGRIFLVYSFKNDERLADSVNHLLVVGFYLINIGYVSLALKEKTIPLTIGQCIEMLSYKIGYVLIVLGIMHFLNLFIFANMRRKAMCHQTMTPAAQQA